MSAPENNSELPDVVSAQGLSGCVEESGTCGKKIVGRGRCRKHYQRWWMRSRNREVAPAVNLKTKTIAERFWGKVDRQADSECWPRDGSLHRSGHGQFFVSPERGTVPAHTFALELASGVACPDDREGCHTCDNPPCCNPAHIYYGTRQENVDDMWSRGRAARGSARKQSRFTETEIETIRVRFAAGATQPQLAAEFQTSSGYISNIVNGLVWAHAPGPILTGRRRESLEEKRAA